MESITIRIGIMLALSTALGCFHHHHFVGDIDPDRERERQEQARAARDHEDDLCYDGDPRACFAVAQYDESHLNYKSSKYTSKQQRIYFTVSDKYDFACRHHVIEACRTLAGWPPHEPRRYQKLCDDEHDAQSCRDAAVLMTNASEATRYHERACTMSNSVSASCVDLAIALATGHGAARDLARSRSMLVQRCHDGGTDACGAFGELVTEGILPAQVTP